MEKNNPSDEEFSFSLSEKETGISVMQTKIERNRRTAAYLQAAAMYYQEAARHQEAEQYDRADQSIAMGMINLQRAMEV
jgi:hypothetical protein